MRNLILITVITLFFSESFLRIFESSIISDQLIYNFPNTKLRNSLLTERNLIINPKKISYIKPKFGGRPIPLINQIQKSIPHKIDVLDGAIENYFYNKGFCNSNYINKDFKKIISIGDSFTFCTSVEENDAWPKKIKLEEEFININYGVPGIGLNEYLEILNNYIDVNVKHTIIAIYEGNDLRDAINDKRFKEDADYNKKVLNKLLSNTKEFSILDTNDNFFTYNLKKYLGVLYSLNVLYGAGKTIFLKVKKNNELENLRFFFTEKGRKYTFNIKNADQDEFYYAKKISQNKISHTQIKKLWSDPIIEMKKISEQYNSKIYFIYIPSSYGVIGNESREVIFEKKENKSTLKKYSLTLQKVFEEICSDLGLNCINFSKIFPKYNSNTNKFTHFKSNMHLTKFGHEIIANEVSKLILNKNK